MREDMTAAGIWRPKSTLGVCLLIGTVTLLVGVALLAARHYTLSGIEAARDWVPTPGVIERGLFLHDDERGRYLDLVHRYEFQGKTYRSDRLALMPGRMGDDILWEEQLLARSPVGSRITCYVDAANPWMAVLDREHGTTGAANIRLIAFSFLLIAGAFLLAAAKKGLASVTVAYRAGWAQGAEFSDGLAEAPRRLRLGVALAFLFNTPWQVQLAWAFFAGFASLFTMLEGPATLRDLWPSDDERDKGEVTRVVASDQ